MRRVWSVATLTAALLAVGFIRDSKDGFQVVYDEEGVERSHVVDVKPDLLHSLTWSVSTLSDLERVAWFRLRAEDDSGPLFEKKLASGDGDLHTLFRPRSGRLRLDLTSGGDFLPVNRVRLVAWNLPAEPETLFESEPNHSWETATPIELGKTVWAGGDDLPYYPLPGQARSELLGGGEDWYRFDYREKVPRLVFFWLELLDRDNIPVDVLVFREVDGELVPYEDGMDPVTPPHQVQAMEGNKFTTRVLREPGSYYLRVLSHHPFYQLKTAEHPLPPYTNPRQAVRTALDYMLGSGDSWHANTPRKGGVLDRVSSYHHETSLCVACHPTQFTLRSQLYAVRRGYPVRKRSQLLFLTERIYNNPTPMHELVVPAHEEVSWTRVISSPANVLSRIAVLARIFEEELSHENRDRFFRGIGEYLKLYYKDREELPPDETNGNRPLVSTFEVAWYSWEILDELYRRLGDEEYAATRDRIRRLLEGAEVKNMIDLCYQTLAFSAIDREAYRQRIKENGERIISYQRPSGQWGATFDSEDPEAEFQTGHCLWTLAEAGYTVDHPAVARGIQYLLDRQQEFGGWFDPLQSYENFATPFRETQMAVLALATLFSGEQKNAGWGTAFPPVPARLDFTRPDRLLAQLDNLWEPPPEELLQDLLKALEHPEVQVRAAAAAALGRTSSVQGIEKLAEALGDPSKIVQRAAAWSLRLLYSRTGQGEARMENALQDSNERVRWGATRIFAQHASELAKNPILAEGLIRRASDPLPSIRMQAVKGMWQAWYWTADRSVRERIEDTFLARLAVEEDDRVVRNLEEGLYILADDNIRYLYNNWIPLLADVKDRDRIVKGRLETEERLAGKLVEALSSGDPRLQQRVLRALSEYHLRSPDSYDLEVSESQRPAGVFIRIGNDIETVKFFGKSADALARALVSLLDSPHPEVRRLAARAAAIVREDRLQIDYGADRRYGLADVLRLAGPYEEGRRKMAEALLVLLEDDDGELRDAAGQVRRLFTPEPGAARERFAQRLASLLQSSYSQARLAGWDLAHQFGRDLAEQTTLEETVHKAYLEADTVPSAYQALPAFPSLLERRDVQIKVYRDLASPDLKVFQAAVELCLKAPELEQQPVIQRRLSGAFTARDAERTKAILELASVTPEYLKDLRFISLLSESLTHSDASLAGAALGLVRKEEWLKEVPAVAEALASRPEVDEPGRVRLPDFAIFRNEVQPILEAVGSDGKACVNCHETHAVFRLNAPGTEPYSEGQLREHYRSALRVVDLANPEESLILKKPTSSAEEEGVLAVGPNAHGGDVRWEKNSPYYRTILEWIYTALQ